MNANPYEKEGLHRRVRLAVINDGMTEAQAAERFGLKLSTVNTIMGNADGVLNGAKAAPKTNGAANGVRAERDAAIVAAVKGGETQASVANRYGMRQAQVSRICLNAGVRMHKPRISSEAAKQRDLDIAEMVRGGATRSETAIAFKVNVGIVSRACKRLGLKPARFRVQHTPRAEVIHTDITAELRRAVTGAQEVVEGSAVAKPNKGGFTDRYQRMTAMMGAYTLAERLIKALDEGRLKDAEGNLGALAVVAEGVTS